jgi:predicted dehydrogenase
MLGIKASGQYVQARELLGCSDVEAVVIATPPNARAALVCMAAELGKHVLCEKPLATRPGSACEAVRAADKAHVQIAMVHNYLCFPEYVAARRIIEGGGIGDVRVVIIDALGVADNAGASTNSYNWRHDPAIAGGGVLMDMLHLVYVAEFLLGHDIVATSGYIDSYGPNEAVESVALCRFESEWNVALVNVGWGQGPGGASITGSLGRIAIGYRNGGCSPFAPLESVVVTTAEGSHIIDTPDGGSGIGSILKNFALSLAEGVPLIADGRAGARALEATIALYEGAATGQVVALPLKADDPLYEAGVAGLGSRALRVRPVIVEKGLFGCGGKEDA